MSSRDTKANKTVNHQNTNPQESSQCLSCEGFKAVTSKESPIERRRQVEHAHVEFDFFRCYAQLLRWHYSDPKKLTPELIALAEAIKRWMEDAHAAIVKAFRNECKNGNTDVVHEALKALGPRALYQEWFNEGLKDLLFLAGKRISLRPPPKVLDFGDDYIKMYRLEDKMQETTVEEATAGDDTLKSQYYKYFPEKREIMTLCHLHGLLHPILHTQVLEDFSVLDANTFCKLLDQVKKNLPSKYFSFQKPA
jgi:hypothetical protein